MNISSKIEALFQLGETVFFGIAVPFFRFVCFLIGCVAWPFKWLLSFCAQQSADGVAWWHQTIAKLKKPAAPEAPGVAVVATPAPAPQA